MARILALSSQVARGHVGLAATVPALQCLGHEVWALPTVVFASRPGLGTLVKVALPAPELAAMLAALAADGCWRELAAVFTGYFPSAASVAAAAAAIGRAKAANPKLVVCVDPVLGDAGRLYVSPATAAAVRDQLLALATVTTPNRFELGWLTGAPDEDLDLAQRARQLGVEAVVVTSATRDRHSVTTALITAAAVNERALQHRAGIPNGAGDLYAGLLLGRLVNGEPAVAAFANALDDLDWVLAASEHKSVLALEALPRRA